MVISAEAGFFRTLNLNRDKCHGSNESINASKKGASERFVLDIGSGDNPHPDATHLCDLYVSSNKERMRDVIIDERPFVICSAEYLPFRRNSFVFAYACHVLEHTFDPAKALREITRVARNGYIETPTYLAERIYGWEFHKWVISFKGGKIFFTKKPAPQKIVNMHYFYKNNTAVRFIEICLNLHLDGTTFGSFGVEVLEE
jgi:SAM-dependent methyltransferase